MSNENIIFKYSREDAIKDGTFKDISELAKDASFKWPVAITTNLYLSYIELPDEYKGEQSEKGRLWDVLNVLRYEASKPREDNFIKFYVSIRNVENEKLEDVEMWAVVEANDDGSPGINVLLPEDY